MFILESQRLFVRDYISMQNNLITLIGNTHVD